VELRKYLYNEKQVGVKAQKDRGQKMPPVLSISLRFSYFLLRLPVDIY
jgi:hypothetical protein